MLHTLETVGHPGQLAGSCAVHTTSNLRILYTVSNCLRKVLTIASVVASTRSMNSKLMGFCAKSSKGFWDQPVRANAKIQKGTRSCFILSLDLGFNMPVGGRDVIIGIDIDSSQVRAQPVFARDRLTVTTHPADFHIRGSCPSDPASASAGPGPPSI